MKSKPSPKQKVDPRFHIGDTILNGRQQELPDVDPKDRRESDDVLYPTAIQQMLKTKEET